MPYLWKIPSDYPELLIGKYERNISPDRFNFLKGKEVLDNKTLPVITFNAKSSELNQYDVLSNSSMIPLVSNKVITFLRNELVKEIQFIDVELKTSDGSLTGYKLLNATEKVFCIDKDKSEYDFVPGTKQIMSFSKLYYKNNCMLGYSIARDGEYCSNLLVSELLSKKMISLKLKGLSLYLPEDWIDQNIS